MLRGRAAPSVPLREEDGLSKLRVPVEPWEAPTRWSHAPVWYGYRLVQAARRASLPGFRTST